MAVRLNKALKELNVGINIVAEFLRKKDVALIDATPNAKITDEQYALLQKEFGEKRDDGISHTKMNSVNNSDKQYSNFAVSPNNIPDSNQVVASSNKKYHVFVSYSRHDYNQVQSIVAEIEKKGYKIWIDKNGIDSGDAFKEVIVKAIKEADVFLFFSSKGANESPWTVKEVNIAVYLKKIIIPVKLDNTEYNDSVLFDLAGLDYVDFIDKSKHIYAINKLTTALKKKIPH